MDIYKTFWYSIEFYRFRLPVFLVSTYILVFNTRLLFLQMEVKTFDAQVYFEMCGPLLKTFKCDWIFLKKGIHETKFPYLKYQVFIFLRMRQELKISEFPCYSEQPRDGKLLMIACLMVVLMVPVQLLQQIIVASSQALLEEVNVSMYLVFLSSKIGEVLMKSQIPCFSELECPLLQMTRLGWLGQGAPQGREGQN